MHAAHRRSVVDSADAGVRTVATGVQAAGRDAQHGFAAQRAASHHGHWHVAGGGRIVTQLAVRAIAPAINSAVRVHSAGVPVANINRRNFHTAQHAAGVNRHGQVAVRGHRRVVAQLAVSVIAPTVDQPVRGQGASVRVADLDLLERLARRQSHRHRD